jgi:hypothetical protein
MRPKSVLTALSLLALLLSILLPISFTQATAAPALVTCVNLQTGTERISHTGTCRYTQEAQANWRKNQSDSAIASGASAKVITICSNKESSPVSYRVIRSKCAKHQVTTVFSRSGALPNKPVIAEAVSFGYDSASLKLATDPAATQDAPIAYYTITSSRGNTQRIYSWKDLSIVISGLQGLTTYTFTVTATTADGTSPVSESSLPVTTPAYVAPVAAATTAPLAAPAITLSTSAETKTVNTAITGYTISSTGGTIASFAISPSAPAGTTFSTSTGLLTGTPSSTQSATAYTITATNATGSATRTFTLTVTAIVYTVGDTGPGGGKIFYVATTPFACGPTRAATCTYLEAAPPALGLSGFDSATTFSTDRSWAQSAPVNYQSITVGSSGSPETATATAIGWGYFNTRAIVSQGNTNTFTSAAALADAYTVTVSGVLFDDWYLPSKDELNQMCKWQRGVAWTSDATVCTGGLINTGSGASGFAEYSYWSSSELFLFLAWVQYFQTGGNQYTNRKSNTFYVRPIRAF